MCCLNDRLTLDHARFLLISRLFPERNDDGICDVTDDEISDHTRNLVAMLLLFPGELVFTTETDCC